MLEQCEKHFGDIEASHSESRSVIEALEAELAAAKREVAEQRETIERQHTAYYQLIVSYHKEAAAKENGLMAEFKHDCLSS